MSKEFEILSNYESLISYVEEIRASLELLHNYMNCEPQFHDIASYFDLIGQHSPNFSLLNLIMNRLDVLLVENQNLVENLRGV